jgi:YVTN family beta-propeller protein
MRLSSILRHARQMPLSLLVFLCWLGCTPEAGRTPLPSARTPRLGGVETNRFLLPTGQVVTPAGKQVFLPGVRPQVLALSPDHRVIALAGRKDALILVAADTGSVLQTVPLRFVEVTSESSGVGTNAVVKSVAHTNTATMSFTGLIFSPDGRHLYLSNTGGDVWDFPMDKSHRLGTPKAFAIPAPKSPNQAHDIPTGLALSADGQRLYVAATLAAQLHELDTRTGRLLHTWETGVAPYDVACVGQKVYVSNQGGRRPGKGDLTAPAGKGTKVRVDPVRHIASEGSVTVIDLAAGKVKSEILVELHASGLAASPDGKYVVVANAGSDTLSVIDTRTDCVVEKIWARQSPADLFGAQPNALTFAPSGRTLYVCNGTQNAVAVVQFEPEENSSRVIGLIPCGWFPGAVQWDAARKRLLVANIRGVGINRVPKPGEYVKFNSHECLGTLSIIPAPAPNDLPGLTAQALENLRYPLLAESRLPARPGQPPRPVPERAGEPSVFKHVVYVIKENRSYDQVLGDMPEGNGDPNLCIFDRRYTPNQHKLAREFVLLDNTYCASVCSADGHQWADSGIANEYVERQITSGTPRSYSSGKNEDGVDALSWASSGFIWTHAAQHGKTFLNFGEWMLSSAGWKDSQRKDKLAWRDFWQDLNARQRSTQLRSRPALASLKGLSYTNTVGWDLRVPDLMRAEAFIRELKRFEAAGSMPQFILLFLPNDHTGGTRNEYPVPGAQVADNDLAFGRVVEALSRSSFWPETCLFAIEDDPQAGWDHVSGYRTTCYVASPYTKRRQVISTRYNQVSLLRTMELILGLPPMNQMDATATPMSGCFVETPDLTPFASVPNEVPLDLMNPDPRKIADRQLRHDALVSARLPLDEPDRCPEDVLNRILWRAMKGSQVPYPEWAVKATPDLD